MSGIKRIGAKVTPQVKKVGKNIAKEIKNKVTAPIKNQTQEIIYYPNENGIQEIAVG